MLRTNGRYMICFIPTLLITLFLFGCSSLGTTETEETDEELETFVQIDQSKHTVQKIVGWLDDTDILVHLGDQEEQELIRLNIHTGEEQNIYTTNHHILTVEINTSLDKILIQEGSDSIVELLTMTTEGEELRRIDLGYSGYISVDWNAVDETLLFLSHYQYDQETSVESSKVMIWNLETNELVDFHIDAIEPSWYSAHLYLYVNEADGYLYIGDTRSTERDQMINNKTIDYHLYQDTFISMEASDINDKEVHLMKDHPFLVNQGALTIPKVSRGEIPIKPFLSQSTRNGAVLGVIANEAIDLNLSLGDFNLCLLDFENNEYENLLELPDNAPIALSPNEQYVLYGWQFENIIELDGTEELISLISDPS
ncbi:hypothetical protein ACFP65_05370 [Marinilactibacillus sp. GCM10026970]|uniref:YqgU-like beta propeller domain-containing protein n=1 Tax=Marinilactibacillus sp. GCM10026970 TaxID=3252642 RepID=UPI003605DE6F